MLTYIHPEAVNKFLTANHLNNFAPTLSFLERLGHAFQNIPYENLTKIIRSHSFSNPEARLRFPETLFDEHLKFGTGGTCFSMTYFMQTILRACGFKTYTVMADRPLAPNTHCLSIIELEHKKYILDPGFMIDKPLPLTDMPMQHFLKPNNIIIGAKGTIPIPIHQMKHFMGLAEKLPGSVVLPYESCPDDGKQYTIATCMHEKTTIRYFFKDRPTPKDEFLKFWLDSFNWPTLRNISITIATESGYIYARNNFLRKTMRDGREQERIKKGVAVILGKNFNIDEHIINEALEIIRTFKKAMSNSSFTIRANEASRE